MSVLNYVEGRFGTNSREKLEKISTGGSSNAKGNKYEEYFAVAKICSAVSNAMKDNSFDNYVVSSQEVAFVDDLCYLIKDIKQKTNYQAKNSSGSAASWTDEIKERCEKQKVIDIEYHGVRESKNVLLVSSQSKCESNQGKIPVHMRSFCSCEYFPYCESSIPLILEHQELRVDLEAMCADNNIQTLDTAFRYLYSVWGTRDEKKTCSVGDIIKEAKKISKPNVFGGLIPSLILPQWLSEKCATFQNCQASIKSGKINISYNGLEVMVENLPMQLDPKLKVEIENTTTPNSFMSLLMNLQSKILCENMQPEQLEGEEG
ncbi:hypothetical protein AAH235_002154 [Providencia stuartii]|uniref:hypothetical protein n=1 Tax=Providencia TaxID=586 RepID=UPI000D9888D2|nr:MULTISPECIES: hypothetical protein [Providencia]RMA15435.1 hypothetical protein EA147_05860 [Providencia stuartii]SPY70980.1 Uncharacterised protein [Providencia stuartii]HEM6870903.1 hypothetical protein [Providencia stuartii]HEM7174687.1 hypothetical protein [Providencia stuartii]HEM7517151.1 hypothetical protein [Providencia stuartii]